MMSAAVARVLPLVVILVAPTAAAIQTSGEPVRVAAAGAMAKAHDQTLTASALSLDGRILASASRDKTIKLWSIPSGELLRTIAAHKDTVSKVAFTGDGRLLVASAWDRTISVSSTEDGRLVGSLKGHAKGVDGILLSPDSTVLLSTGGGELKAWSMPDGQLLATMPSERSADEATFLPDGKTFAIFSGAKLRFSALPDLRDAGTLDCASGGFVRPRPAISADGTKLVVVCEGRLTVWSLGDRRLLTTIPSEGRFNNTLQLSPDGATVATGDPRGAVRLWNLAQGQPGAVLTGHDRPVVSLAFTSDGKRLISGSWDGTVRVWSVAEGTALTVFEGHRGGISHLHVTPDGSTIISGQTPTMTIHSSTTVSMGKADASIALWDVTPPRFRRFLGR